MAMDDREERVSLWTCDQVEEWLLEKKFDEYVHKICRQHKIDGQALLALTEKDLKEPLKIRVLGDVKRLILNIDSLRYVTTRCPAGAARDDTDDGHGGRNERFSNGSRFRRTVSRKTLKVTSDIAGNMSPRNGLDTSSDDEDDRVFSRGPASSKRASNSNNYFPAEPHKTLVSFIYCFTVFLITSFVMTIVHDRVPDTDTYPPLPDIFLDNVPLIPWAFKLCELIALVLVAIMLAVIFLHKHRLIVLRRLFALCGTVFMLRCITMFVTSLSVPGKHLQCSSKVYGDIWAKLHRTLEIWLGLGMSLTGVNTCGDYMFSGHTVVLTILNFFITEYTPRRYFLLHTATWVMNLFGIVCILASHNHYTLDCVAAFYVTTRLFLYYHTLANSVASLANSDHRTRTWFPLFFYFEENVQGRVPNEYQWPLTWLSWLRKR